VKRFIALVDSERDDLAGHLRQAVSLLNAHDIAVDWAQLLLDLRRWDSEFRSAQWQWSRDFWAERRAEQPEVDSPTIV
jgi:CRISPR type I-E-associated protein CasB/Cse2